MLDFNADKSKVVFRAFRGIEAVGSLLSIIVTSVWAITVFF